MNSLEPTTRRIGDDRLLGINDVSKITGFSNQTASQIIRDSGKRIVIHRRIFVFESSFHDYLKEQEAAC